MRDKEIEKLKSADDWSRRQAEVKEKLMGFVGPFPKKGPLIQGLPGSSRRMATGLKR